MGEFTSIQDVLKERYNSLIERTGIICPKHGIELVIAKRGQGSPTCRDCWQEQKEKEQNEYAKSIAEREKKRQTVKTLELDSIILDDTIKGATLENFNVESEIEGNALNFAKRIAEFYKDGGKGNTVLSGWAGTGKSHLAMGILKEYNKLGDKSALFVSYTQLMRLVKGSFNDKGSRYTPDRVVELMLKPDLLVLDDIGSERHSEFNEELLIDILDGRKNTIITTNYTGGELQNIYQQRTSSRLLRGIGDKSFKFEGIRDKRVLPF